MTSPTPPREDREYSAGYKRFVLVMLTIVYWADRGQPTQYRRDGGAVDVLPGDPAVAQGPGKSSGR
jgi:hypothetical protein